MRGGNEDIIVELRQNIRGPLDHFGQNFSTKQKNVINFSGFLYDF